MSVTFHSRSSHTSLRAPHLELVVGDDVSYVHVEGWGHIENIRLLPMDRLIIHKNNEIDREPEYQSGELLLLRPKGFGRLILGRVYGEHILMEPFGKVVSLERWSIVGAILAVERNLGSGSPLDEHAYIGLYNAPSHYEEHIHEDHVCEPLYIEELSKRLSQEDADASCVVSIDQAIVPVLLAQVPNGKLWISPNTKESVPNFCKEWQITSKRQQRKNWMKRHKKECRYHSHLPKVNINEESDVPISLASK